MDRLSGWWICVLLLVLDMVLEEMHSISVETLITFDYY